MGGFMEKRILVAGCRFYENYEQAEAYIDFCLQNIKKENSFIFVSGGCRGADQLGELYAQKHGYEVERYPADWERYGKAAGPIRNQQMINISDYIICFWDGKSRGTKSTIEFAYLVKKPIRIKKICSQKFR